MKNLILLVSAASLFSGQVAAQTPTPSAAPVLQNVNCPAGDKIQAALDASSQANPIVLRIFGTCTEDVTIERDDVVLRGKTDGKRQASIKGSINVVSSDRVVIKDMKVVGSKGYGVFGSRGASILIQNVFMKFHTDGAIGVARKSFVRIEDSNLFGSGASEYTVVAADGSGIRMFNTEVVAVRNKPGSGISVALFRSSHARIDEGNTIRHIKSSIDTSRALALVAMDNSNMRVQRAGNTVTGNVVLQTNSSMDLRDTVISGNVRLTGQAILQLGSGGGIDGRVSVERRSMLEPFTTGFAGVSGPVTCTGESAAAGATAGLTLNGCAVLP